MSSAPDCAVLKANFPAIYANRRRLRIKDPECTDFIHLVGTCEYGKSPTTGYSTRLNTVTIGRIYGDQPNGVGKIEFNDRFLREHPEYADVDVYRLNNRPAGVLVVPKGTPVSPQDLAQAVYDEIRNSTEDQYISPRDQTKLSAILDHATTNVDTEEIKERNQLYHRRRSTVTEQARPARNSSYPQNFGSDLKLKIHALGQQNRQLLEVLEQPSDREAFEPILGRQEALKSFLAKHGLTLERNFDLSQYLADKYCENFPELKEELKPILAQLAGPDCNFLKLPWQITSILPLPNLPQGTPKASAPSLEDLAQGGKEVKAEPKNVSLAPVNGRSIGATLSLDVLLSQHPIDKAMPELVPTEEDSQLLASLIITSALSPNFKIVDFNEVLDSYELPYDGSVNAKQLHLLNASLTEPELDCFWRSHNEAVFAQIAERTGDKSKKHSGESSAALTPMLYDIRLAAAIDPALESAKRRLLAQHTAEMLLAVLNEADTKGTDATDALKELDAQAAHLASNIAATLTTPPVPSPALQLAALALPQEGALCYSSPYEGDLTGASSVLYVKGASLCPQEALPDDAMSVAAPLMVMARPDLTYSMILSKMRTWRAQGQRMLMELDPLNTKIRQICGNHFMDGTLSEQGTKVRYHGMTITALKLNVSWHDLYGLDPTNYKPAADNEPVTSKEPNWYLYLYFNSEHYERLKQIMMLNTAKVNEQHEKSQLDLIVATDEGATTELEQVEQHVNAGLKTPLKDQMFQCFSDHSTELNENFDLYCAEHSFKVVLSSEDLPEDLVFAALEQRHQLEQRVRAQCTVHLDHSTTTTLTPWPQLGSLVALLGQELYESVEQSVADYHAHHLRNQITMPDKSVALMLLSLASLKVKDPKAKFSLKAELNRTLIPAERKFLELLGLDVASTLGPKA